MALRTSTTAPPISALGDSLSSYDAEYVTNSCPRLLLFGYCKFGHSYLFHDSVTHTLLVWIYKPRKRVCQLVAGLGTKFGTSDEGLEWYIYWRRAFLSAVS